MTGSTTFKRGMIALHTASLLLILVGVTAFVTAVSTVLLPHETAYLHATVLTLDHAHHDHSLIGFIIHNRIAFAGTLIALGWLYLWLIHNPLRQSESWAWWVLLVSVLCGCSSFFAYRSRGYFDTWHAIGTGVISAVFIFGLWQTFPTIKDAERSLRRIISSIFNSPVHLLMHIWATGNLFGGAGVFLAGLWPVFVPQDLAYMQTTVNGLQQLNPRLIAFIAHDRTGFGGALLALGIVLTAIILVHTDTSLDKLWPHLSWIWLLGFLTTIVVHFFVGYTSLSHLMPFLIKDSAFLLAWLIRLWQQPAPILKRHRLVD